MILKGALPGPQLVQAPFAIVFLYHHPARRDAPMDVDFGVEVTRSFEASGEVYATETPAGEVATAVHAGPYDRLTETHDAIYASAEAHQMQFAGWSWEIYGDWSDDPSGLETTIVYLLKWPGFGFIWRLVGGKVSLKHVKRASRRRSCFIRNTASQCLDKSLRLGNFRACPRTS